LCFLPVVLLHLNGALTNRIIAAGAEGMTAQ
jgi:hypothetical protein